MSITMRAPRPESIDIDERTFSDHYGIEIEFYNGSKRTVRKTTLREFFSDVKREPEAFQLRMLVGASIKDDKGNDFGVIANIFRIREANVILDIQLTSKGPLTLHELGTHVPEELVKIELKDENLLRV
jgi:hypothetical protein